jgi:hypothetical protein
MVDLVIALSRDFGVHVQKIERAVGLAKSGGLKEIGAVKQRGPGCLSQVVERDSQRDDRIVIEVLLNSIPSSDVHVVLVGIDRNSVVGQRINTCAWHGIESRRNLRRCVHVVLSHKMDSVGTSDESAAFSKNIKDRWRSPVLLNSVRGC